MEFSEIKDRYFPVAVVGGGLAGYTAALTLKSLRVPYVWLGTKPFGEKLPAAEYVRNVPAFTGDGTAFAAALREQAEREGIAFTRARIDGIFAGNPFTLTQTGEAITARAVILATGVQLSATVKGESELIGRGVSYCAVCDGALYRGKDIAVLIYSEEFAQEVEYLAGFARTVTVFCVRCKPQFRAENILIVEGIPKEIVGEKRVQAVRHSNGEVAVDGVFLLKHSVPPSALAGGLRTENGAVCVGRNMETNLDGLFAAGDVTGKPFQFVKAAGEGLVAAYSAAEYVKLHQ